MTTHFSTVPVDEALREAHPDRGRCRPLVLVVEDEPVIAGTLADILNRNGLAALSANDPISAIETALVIPPEIVIADFALPRMSGIDLVSQIRRGVPDCDALLFAWQFPLGGYSAEMAVPHSRCSILYKPVHPADLLHSVFEILARRGHSLALPKPLLRPSLYDLSKRRGDSHVFDVSVVSHRRRSARPA